MNHTLKYSLLKHKFRDDKFFNKFNYNLIRERGILFDRPVGI